LPYLGLLEIAVAEADWDEANRLADETRTRSAGNLPGMYELAFELVQIPGRRDEAVALLREVAEGFPGPDPPVLLGAILERLGDPEAQKFIDLARKKWNKPTPKSFDEVLAERRAFLAEYLPE
jgi:hypothetical protein